MVLICEVCKEEYNVVPSRSDSKYCSNACFIETLKKAKLELICEQCDRSFEVFPYQKDYKYCSTECYRDYQEANCQRAERSTKEYKKWRLEVYKEDNFTCQKCGDDSGGNLHAHHILSFSRYIKGRTVVANGVTLCKECHNEFHKLYGTLKFTDKDYWEWL